MKQSSNIINSDIKRYKKNKTAANLALIGLAAGCVYFLVLYSQVDNNNYYYNWSLAFDVIYNLFFLLLTFLCSEQVKNYERKMFVPQLIIGSLQIARIFWLPLTGYLDNAITLGVFFGMMIPLAISGLCIISSAVIGFIRSKEVENFKNMLDRKEIDLDAELKKVDAFADGGK